MNTSAPVIDTDAAIEEDADRAMSVRRGDHRLPKLAPSGPMRSRVVAGAAASAGSCAVVLCSPGWLPWWATLLTLGQVLAMFGISQDKRIAWAFGLGLQAPWATYDVMSGQYPFLITAVLVSVAQIRALRRHARAAAVSTPGPSAAASLLDDDTSIHN